MEIHCPGCAHPLTIPDELCTDDGSLRTFTSVDCPNCGSVSLGDGFRRTITFQDSRDDPENKRVAHFALLKKLGRGGFGTVWLAHDLALGRQVALKLPASEGHEADNLLHEAQTAASLRHPNIVSIYEVGSENGRAYIASEFIDGLTLRDLLTTGRPPIPRTIELLVSVAQALHHAHEHGVVHRDVKPANILLNQQGQPFVADFGIAKRLSADATISSEGQVIGTARYMSPEQASGKTRETDRRSDVYALGVILFEMLTGDTPFRGNMRALLHQKTLEEAPSPRKLDPAVPKDLETICLKCLEREPGKRYQTAAEVADELTRFAAREPISARPISSAERLWRRCRRRPVVASLLVSLFLSLSLGLLGVSFFWLEAKKSAELTQRSLYRSQMNLAANHLDRGDLAGVRRALERFGPDTPLAGLRGFAWHYFDHATAPLVEVANQGDVVHDVAVSRDGDVCAACGNDRFLRVWDSKTGELIRTLALETGRFRSLAFSPTSSQLAAGASDGLVRIYNPLKDARHELLKLSTHNLSMGVLARAAGGKWLAVGSGDGAVKLVRLSLLMQPSVFWHDEHVRAVAFLPDGKRVAAGTGDGGLRIWNFETGESQVLAPPGGRPLTALSMQPAGNLIAIGGGGPMVSLWDRNSLKLVEQIEAPAAGILALAFSPSGRRLAVACRGGLLLVYDQNEWRQPRWKIEKLEAEASTLAFATDEASLIAACQDGHVRFFDASTGERLSRTIQLRTLPLALCLAEQGRLLAIGADAGELYLWDLTLHQMRHVIKGHSGRVNALATMPDGAALVSAGRDHDVKLWDTATGEPITTLSGHVRQVFSLTVSPDGSTIASGGLEGDVRIWRTSP